MKKDPCNPSPCGPNSVCELFDGELFCHCLDNYIGFAPNCRPECVVDSDCAKNLACFNQRCSDPCSGSCGLFAECSVIDHRPICFCSSGFTGNPFVKCFITSKIVFKSSQTNHALILNKNNLYTF